MNVLGPEAALRDSGAFCYAGLRSAAPLSRLLYASEAFSGALTGVVNGEVAW
ncbi:Hypothetical protein ACGLYG10_2910 [Actinomyces glycerinitolerans]|uniref:Uncharacterized protein n=1 Tax=Actinomyces glycerinitolerans TaxID=1892869 RepID=A0A1M4S343_9ACTO|nr:Hypothetical protein ACGLYG10_2910 [Actinomyces glycerinitolerans]